MDIGIEIRSAQQPWQHDIINQAINQSINIRLLRRDKMQANNSKQKGNTVSKKKSRSRE